MARKATKPSEIQAENIEAADVEAFDEAEPSDAVGRGRSMSKAGAARAALDEGYSVPKQASAYIKQKYGIDISPQQFSAEKSRIKLRSGGLHSYAGGSGASQPGERRFLGQSIAGQPDLLQALEVMKPLIDQLGADKVKRMVDLLG